MHQTEWSHTNHRRLSALAAAAVYLATDGVWPFTQTGRFGRCSWRNASPYIDYICATANVIYRCAFRVARWACRENSIFVNKELWVAFTSQHVNATHNSNPVSAPANGTKHKQSAWLCLCFALFSLFFSSTTMLQTAQHQMSSLPLVR